MLIIIDPSLKSYNGHFLTYDKVLADEAKSRGERCTVLAARSVEQRVAGGLDVIPCFRYGLEATLNDEALATAFLADLMAGTRSVKMEPRTVLFLHTTTHRQIEPAVQVLTQDRLRDSTLVILLRYSTAPNPHWPNAGTVRQYRDALRSIQRLGMAHRVRLVTDSELLAAEYQAITDLRIELMPIPHAGDTLRADDTDSAPRLVYLGNARSTKGFQYLPYMVSQIRPTLDSGAWAAEFQANVMFRRDTESVAALCALREEPVTLLEDELSMHQYEQLLNRASLILLPYQTLYYHSQTSGVFAEAIGRGIPVVVPRGTWMASQIGESGAGMLFAPGDRVDFADTVKRAMSAISKLTGCARALQPTWIAKHNPAAFVEHLLDREVKP
jgi:hypothetical protein